jgi:hypothetical protein
VFLGASVRGLIVFFMSARSYAEKLKDPRWQRKRLEIMERDKFTCQHCRDETRTLNVHHKHYKKRADPWDYEDGLLITLCESCHELLEFRIKELSKFMSDSCDNSYRLYEYAVFISRLDRSNDPVMQGLLGAQLWFQSFYSHLVQVLEDKKKGGEGFWRTVDCNMSNLIQALGETRAALVLRQVNLCAPVATAEEVESPVASFPDTPWGRVLTEVQASRPLLLGWLEMGELEPMYDGNVAVVSMPPEEEAAMSHLMRPVTRKFLEETLSKIFGKPVAVEFTLKKAA